MRPQYTFTELRERAREQIKDGRLPHERGVLLAGYDGNDPCALCGFQIDTGEVDYEVELRSPSDKTKLHFHIPCHYAWLAECATYPEGRPRR